MSNRDLNAIPNAYHVDSKLRMTDNQTSMTINSMMDQDASSKNGQC